MGILIWFGKRQLYQFESNKCRDNIFNIFNEEKKENENSFLLNAALNIDSMKQKPNYRHFAFEQYIYALDYYLHFSLFIRFGLPFSM